MDERSPEEIATAVRDAVDALNVLLREAAGRGLNVELEAHRVDVIDVRQKAARLLLHGIFQRVEPTPRPSQSPPPPKKRGHN
jgi:non-ribosomal peptide synthetase component F